MRQLETEPFYPPAPREPVLPLLEVAVIAGLRYAVYGVVAAASLREVTAALLLEEQLAPVGLVARVVLDAARALARNAPGHPHGGIADGSVLIGFDGVVRVLDFGAPRTGRFQPRGARSFPNDVFALGAVLHAALTGFTGHYGEAMAEGLQLPPPSLSNPEVPPALDALVLRATAREPQSRPADAGLLADELEAAMAGVLFSTGDLAAVAGGLLAEHRSRLERLLAGAPLGALEVAPSLTPARVEPKAPAPLVPWATGPIEASAPPRLEDAVDPTPPALELLGLEAEEPTQPGVQSPLPQSDPTRMAEETPAGDTRPEATEVKALEFLQPTAELTTSARATAPPPQGPSPSRGATARPRTPGPDLSAADLSGDSSDERTVVHFVPKADPPTRLPSETLPGRGPGRAVAASAGDAATRPQLPPVPERPGKVRNTTVRERARARGQERLETPPLGLPPLTETPPKPAAPGAPPPSEASLPVMPSVAFDEAPAPDSRGAVLRVVLAVVLAALAIVAVGVHELAPELIDSLRAKVGTTAPSPAAEVEAAEAPPDESPAGPALERDPRPTKAKR